MFTFALLFAFISDPKTIWNRLDERSLSEALAFYSLYPESKEGKLALDRASQILVGKTGESLNALVPYLIGGKASSFSKEACELIERLSANLPNRKLKGSKACSEKEVLALPASEIDLGRALLLSQLDGQSDDLEQVENYCALLDLMALRILTELPINATPEEKIRATNRLIFEIMQFRFPPHSIYAKEIDLYTFLPSVMDNHLGVCLGVTALYLAVAQRIDLPLEAITPPGHIYIRYKDKEKLINIETTARGIDIPTEHYLNVNTCSLPQRTIKEVVGLTHVNQASIYLQNEKFEEAARCYEKAALYLPDDSLVKELRGFSYLFIGRKEEGEALLKEIKDHLSEHAIAKSTMPEDYLSGKVDAEGIRVIFQRVDEKRESILAKQRSLSEVLKKFPHFREGLEQLAVCWVQLNRPKEALDALKRYHAIDPTHPVIEYYLAVLHGERADFPSCWTYLKNAESLTKAREFEPKALRELRKELILHSPE